MEITSLEYLAYRKANPTQCWVIDPDTGRRCTNEVASPHHLKAVGAGRNRLTPKLEHYMLAPDLCWIHHQEYHQKGERKFIEKYGNIWRDALLELAKYLFRSEDV
jgi:hypothetical protein